MKLVRKQKSPILMVTNNKWENKAVFNPAAAVDGEKIILLYRAQGEDNISRLGIAELKTPTQISERKNTPLVEPDPESEYETLGVEDPRISRIGDIFYMTYVAVSKYPNVITNPVHTKDGDWRVRVSLTRTLDFKTWVRYGVIVSHIDSKDAALFPEKIDNNFCLLHRVIPQIRIAVASDARRYKERGPIFGPRENMWDCWRVGIGAPPIKSPYGWLLFYHGVDDQKIYRLGLALLDLHDPSIVIARTPDPLLEPEESWEKDGQVKNVVFTCGAIEDNDNYWIYYGGGDTAIGVASISKNVIWTWAKKESTKSRYHEFEQIGNLTTEENQSRS